MASSKDMQNRAKARRDAAKASVKPVKCTDGLTPQALVTKFCGDMPAAHRKANVEFFESVVFMISEGGQYHWPRLNLVFIVRNGKFIQQ